MRILIAADTFAPDVNGAARFAERLAAGWWRAGTMSELSPLRSPEARHICGDYEVSR